MDKAYYREYFTLERQHWWFRARASILMDHLRSLVKPSSPSNLRILNVGASTGYSSELLAQFGNVTSVEYDGDCCDFTKSKTGLELLQASVTDLPFPSESFDLVCCFDVVEHVEDQQSATKELHRVCRSGGLVCVTVPAFMFLWTRHDDVNHHVRRYTSPELRQVLGQTGASPVFHSYFNCWLFFPIALFRLAARFLGGSSSNRREDAGSDFFAVQNPLLNKLFYGIFRSESFLLRNGIPLPVGVSILSTWRK
jgi:SAM-dependent methyltransferase